MTSSGMEAIKKQLLQHDFRQEIEQLDTKPWLTVYSNHRGPDGNGGCFCALVSKDKVAKVMGRDSWDLMIGNGLPGFSQSFGGKTPQTTYHRFGSDDGIEPLVFVRSFHGLKPDFIELLEEFRHLLNLYYDRFNERYLRFDDNGEEDVVAEVTRDRVRIKTRPLRQFLAVRQLHLAVLFDSVAFGPSDPAEIESIERELTVRRPDVRYSLHVGDDTIDGRTFSRLLGKRLITPLPIEESGIWPYEEKPKPHVEFSIGLDEQGKEVLHSCAPEKLANYFGENQGSPHFLTPVVFRREVLKKYFDHPEKYEISDGYLRCAGLWGLRLDNDSEDRVTVFLGDLGQTLSYEEQHYWRSFNIAPVGDGKDLSETNVKRSFGGEFADPTSPDLVFKWKLTEFQEQWQKRFGWQLIRLLRDEDAHVFKKLRVPLTKSLAEFEDQLLGLTKVLVDSLNDSEIAKALNGPLPDEKSIAKLKRFLEGKGYPSIRRDVDFLLLLQKARSSGAAHRKGDSFEKVAKKLGLTTQQCSEVFSNLLRRAIEMIDGLTEFFLAEKSSSENIGA
jgi:hypothetical protein